MRQTRRQFIAAATAGILLPRVARAISIPYYWMSSLAHLSTSVVAVAERSVSMLRDGEHVLACQVTQTFQGPLQPGLDLLVELDAGYVRAFPMELMGLEPRTELPLDEAVLFLEPRDPVSGRTRPVIGGMKPLVAGVAYRYGQFMGNPGPLCLDLQGPERMKAAEVYDRDAFLEDVVRSVASGARLKKPRPRTL